MDDIILLNELFHNLFDSLYKNNTEEWQESLSEANDLTLRIQTQQDWICLIKDQVSQQCQMEWQEFHREKNVYLENINYFADKLKLCFADKKQYFKQLYEQRFPFRPGYALCGGQVPVQINITQ